MRKELVTLLRIDQSGLQERKDRQIHKQYTFCGANQPEMAFQHHVGQPYYDHIQEFSFKIYKHETEKIACRHLQHPPCRRV